MLNGGDWADPPWERAPDQDDATSIAFRGQPCDLSECHHPVHAFDHPRRSLRHLEWFNREPVQSLSSNAEEMS
ncbi:Uncharacterised protein (plasmid) [Tsukamurella tyrosinosolvens]|uniref:Uncharacterized protein n=2 Tax=Tsukamurella tyrosinosolvens TaxID=57704 RepID=A0A1H4VJN6_TSUTY|nr:hypothetical protein SAMN04489793_3249 [Tsukamurella tyrosinosolvens]VEH90475.1 Uncharacterised protein [Tsukamurella tyrosinosolvens]